MNPPLRHLSGAMLGQEPPVEGGLLAPFRAVARWLQRALPPGLRGLTLIDLESDPGRLPRRARVRLVLPDTRLLWREIDLPDLAAERRAAWIAARLDEVSPWAAGSYLWAEGAAQGGRLRVALAPAEPVQALQTRLADSGRRLCEVTAGPLWLVEDRASLDRLTGRLALVWAGVLVLGVALAAWSWTRITEAHAAQALAEARLMRLVAESSSTSAATQAAQALLAAKTEAASLATVLDRLAASLPLDSYLETLRLTPAEFEISGRSAAPEAIIPALEGRGGFRGVDFAGASARDAGSGLYSFTLAGRTGADAAAEAAP